MRTAKPPTKTSKSEGHAAAKGPASVPRPPGLPARYEPLYTLGEGGGGLVWAVRDRASGSRAAHAASVVAAAAANGGAGGTGSNADPIFALKLLAEGASEAAALALVRETTALSGLEGLGVPQVIAFGLLPSGQRYLVRELVAGRSLDDVFAEEADWVEPLARTAEQLTVLHRAGLLHGDVKPANVIVGDDGRATLVDLGLAIPWREEGSRPRGLTPKYAAPELLGGDPLTVRGEVYALGATLAEGLERAGSTIPLNVQKKLAAIARRATESSPTARHPSAGELASAIRHAAGLPAAPPSPAPWPVIGMEAVAQALSGEVQKLAAGGTLYVQGAKGSGRSTLVRRLAWALGIVGRSARTEAELDALEDASRETVLVIDDFARLDDDEIDAVKKALARGMRLVAVVDNDKGVPTGDGALSFVVPPLDPQAAEELVRRALPSLPESLRAYVVAESRRLPGVLRQHVRSLARAVVVSREEVDAALKPQVRAAARAAEAGQVIDEWVAIEEALDRGRFGEASDILTECTDGDPVRSAVAWARLALGRGDAEDAAARLDAVAVQAKTGPFATRWSLFRGRAFLRQGDFAAAIEQAKHAATASEPEMAAEAIAVEGLALAYVGDEAGGQARLEEAAALARGTGSARTEAIVLGMLAIGHQRAGRSAEARATYQTALTSAEAARDAAAVATMRLNLASLAQTEGDLAQAIVHLEAATDLGGRAGGLVAVKQAQLNLASLDLYLGRYARAHAALSALEEGRSELSPAAQAYLSALGAELASKTGDLARSVELYKSCAAQYRALGRTLDEAEARLEAIVARAAHETNDRDGDPASAPAALLARELATIEDEVGPSGFGEHAALASIARGTVALLGGDEASARKAFDDAYDAGKAAGRREWTWRALEARARLAATQGSRALSRRDSDEALAMLEETAGKLPRDLREVFWDDPRRRSLRVANETTYNAPISPGRTMASAANATGAAGLPIGSLASFGSAHGFASGSGSSHLSQGRPDADRLARIFEITRELATEVDLEQLLAKVVDHAIALLGGERGLVVLAREDGRLETRSARGLHEPHARFSRSVAERVIATGEPVVAKSALHDDRLAHAASVHQLMIESVACVPVRSPDNRTIGALYIETRLSVGRRFESELPTLCAFADQAAIAMENARLLAENRQRAAELEVANGELSAAKDKLAQSLDRRTEQLETVRRDLKEARATLRSHFGYAGLVGTSAPMRKLYALLERVKDTDVPVLITGESGTGKEVVAKALHSVSTRARAPYLAVNCGAIPANLLESELFGHVRGAFTGADRDRKGLFREAAGGTVLLDEIGEMPLAMQPGLLRVLQEKTVRPVGGANEEKCDVRIVAATNRDLQQRVAEGEFREDLFYRLHVIELHVPPLRERLEDIAPLVDHFLTLFAARHRRERGTISRAALRRLSTYNWPGNVRQLEHVLLNAWLMSDSPELDESDIELPANAGPSARLRSDAGELKPLASPRPGATGPSAGAVASGGSVRPARFEARAETPEEHKQSEKDRILGALAEAGWNRLRAAQIVNMPRRTFYRRLREYGIL